MSSNDRVCCLESLETGAVRCGIKEPAQGYNKGQLWPQKLDRMAKKLDRMAKLLGDKAVLMVSTVWNLR